MENTTNEQKTVKLWTNPDKSGKTNSFSTEKIANGEKKRQPQRRNDQRSATANTGDAKQNQRPNAPKEKNKGNINSRRQPKREQNNVMSGGVNVQSKETRTSVAQNEKGNPRQNQNNANAQQKKPYVQKKGGEIVVNSANKGANRNKNAKQVKIHFLGGVEEIGKNCTAIEYDNQIIVVDAGLTFPNEEMPGIDLVIPDTSFLTQNADKVLGIILTHGHEDHIGALPYILNDLKVPVFGCKLTLMILENKLKEKRVDADLHTIRAGNTIKLGDFSIEFIHVNHSIEGSVALSITTPAGVIVHTGDFKIDYTPVDGEITNLNRFSEIGKKGVLCLLGESTNVEKPGYTMSERTVGKALDNIFGDNISKRIIVATFASNVHRLQQIIDLAEKYKRKVALSGRSMLNIADAAIKIGALHVNEENIVDVEKIDKIADKDLVIISTGSQGEPMSALTRMAADNFNKVKIGENDCIIISASPIPGNEKMVYRVINNLYKLGADVIYSKLHDIHVSGHACQEELKIIHTLVNPQYFIPVHGEYRHLKMHKDLAMSLGMNERNILIPEIGDTIEVSERLIRKNGKVQAGAILVDGLGFGEMDSVMLRDRKHIAEDGLVIVVVSVNGLSGEVVGEVEVMPKGVALPKDADKIILEGKQVVADLLSTFDLKSFSGRIDAKDAVRSRVRNFMDKKIKKRPMVIPIIMEI